MNDVTRLLNALQGDDPHAAEQLLPLLYDELRRLAAAWMAREQAGPTLDATALVHEAYLRLVGDESERRFTDRQHFFRAAATAMRRILIDRARRKRTRKHGGERQCQQLDAIAAAQPDEELLAVDTALEKLAASDPLKAKLVELRFFAGLTGAPAAEVLGIAPITADRLCQAIQHAHQKGIIHRDVKPWNVLVTLYDGKPVPKVIDFGVAKAIEQQLTERKLYTHFGSAIGTFEYLSPDQQMGVKLGVENPWMLTTRNNLAVAYDQAGEFAKAETLHRAALDRAQTLRDQPFVLGSADGIVGWQSAVSA